MMQIHIRKLQQSIVLPVLLLTIFLTSPLYAGTAGKLEALLDKNPVTLSEAAALILEASGIQNDAQFFNNPLYAFLYAKEKKWLSEKSAHNEYARLDRIALIIMRSFELKGGVFFSLVKSPHYAYRELVYKNVIRNMPDPHVFVSGKDLLLIISRLLSMKENP